MTVSNGSGGMHVGVVGATGQVGGFAMRGRGSQVGLCGRGLIIEGSLRRMNGRISVLSMG